MEAPNSRAILIVEDSQEDYETTVRAFRKIKLANPVVRCEDGSEALDYLHRRGKFSDAEKFPRPRLILLDLNLPGMDGREVLEEMKRHPDFKRIPIVVMTTSTDQKDIDRCYEMGANSFVHKPVDTNGFMSAVQKLGDYWFEVVALPEAPFHP